MLVHKTGRTSGYSIGKITGNASTFIFTQSHGTFQFNDLICTTVLSKMGDSGSLLLSLDGNKALSGSSKCLSHYCDFS